MCENCFVEIDEFPSYIEENEFRAQLTQKLNLKTVELVERSAEYKGDFHAIYKCSNCKTIWWISLPENAWRGYCLKEVQAKRFIKKYKKSDRSKKYGCLALLFLLLVLVCLRYFLKK
jgi:hypothetical protein